MNEEKQNKSESGQIEAASAVAGDFAGLSPDLVLDAAYSQGFAVDGRLLALNSYENRVYQLGVEDRAPIIAKFYRPRRWSDAQIREEHAFLMSLQESEIPVIAPMSNSDGESLFFFDQHRFAIFPRQGGRAPELSDRETLIWLGRYLGRIHAVGAQHLFVHRPSLSVEELGDQSFRTLLQGPWIDRSLREAYEAAASQMLDKVKQCFAASPEFQQLCLHGDCHLGNVLWLSEGAQQGPHFLDFDDSRNGPAVQDLWMLLSGSRSEMQTQLCDILEGYEDFFEFDTRQLGLIEPLRCLRMLHYSAWLAQRWDDPAFKQAFPWFATPRYWQEKILEMREQIALLDEEPLQV